MAESREADHDTALRSAVAQTRTAVLKGSAMTTMARAATRLRVFCKSRAWNKWRERTMVLRDLEAQRFLADSHEKARDAVKSEHNLALADAVQSAETEKERQHAAAM